MVSFAEACLLSSREGGGKDFEHPVQNHKSRMFSKTYYTNLTIPHLLITLLGFICLVRDWTSERQSSTSSFFFRRLKTFASPNISSSCYLLATFLLQFPVPSATCTLLLVSNKDKQPSLFHIIDTWIFHSIVLFVLDIDERATQTQTHTQIHTPI